MYQELKQRAPIHPGIIIREDYLKPLSLSITQLAKNLGVSRVTLSRVINGKASVTPNMAIRLSRVFNTTPELWLGLQGSHDLWRAYNNLKVGEI